MTCHIAISSGHYAVMFSDSQGSTDTEERHGLQKQFAGGDYLIGGAGNALVLKVLFEKLAAGVAYDGSAITAANIHDFVQGFVENEVQPQASDSIQVIIATPDATGRAVRCFYPELLRSFDARTSMAAIGSGAEFVFRAFRRDSSTGITHELASLPDMLVLVENLANAANESLTVDDSFLVGFLCNGKAYLMGDRRIQPLHTPAALQNAWSEATNRFEEIMAAVRTMASEIHAAQEACCSVRTGVVSQADVQRMISHSLAIGQHRQVITLRLNDYVLWYDQLLGRGMP